MKSLIPILIQGLKLLIPVPIPAYFDILDSDTSKSGLIPELIGIVHQWSGASVILLSQTNAREGPSQ